MKEFIALFFSFRGRVGRQHFWLVNLTSLIFAWFAYQWLVDRPSIEEYLAITDVERDSDLQVLLFMVPALWVALWVQVASTIRRLHDLGVSGWWYLLLCIPVIGHLIVYGFCAFQPSGPDNKWGQWIIDCEDDIEEI